MNRFTGNYTSDQLAMDIEVFVKDSTLMAQATGQSSFPLTAIGESTVRFQQAGLVMEFDSLADDRFQQFILKQGGGEFLFTRE